VKIKMPFGGVFSVLTLMVFVALAFVLVGSPNTAGIISALGGGFSGSLSAAEGQGVKKAA
jgi:hypothetical protein